VQFPLSLTQIQIDRISSLRDSILASTPVKLAASKLAGYGGVGGAAGGGSGAGQGGSGGADSSRGVAGLASPYGKGGAAGAGGDTSSLPAVRLTEEVASSALALNNIQLAVACLQRLQGLLEQDVAEVFTDERYVSITTIQSQ
jgi:hypothetical protein